MNKVLVKVYVPVIEENYDIWIPINRKIHNVIKLLIKAIYDLSGGYYRPHEIPNLYNKITAIPCDMNKSVKESNIKNGTELVLL